MAGTAHAGNSTRIHWGGAQSNTDIHFGSVQEPS